MQNGFYQVSDLRQSIRGILTGLNTNNVVDWNGKLQRVATTILMKGDIPEMSDRYALDLYDGVFDYVSPPNLFGSLVQDVRPQGVSRNRFDIPYKKPLMDFDLMKQRLNNGVLLTFEQRGVQQVMRLAQTRATPRVDLGSVAVLGTWVAGGAAQSLALDQTVFYQSPAAIRLNLNSAPGGGLGYAETTINSANLSAYQGVGVVFVAIRLPDANAASSVSSIGVHVGNNNANYWDVSATQGFLGAWTYGDFLIVALDLANASTTGSVTNTAITYLRVYFNYTSATPINNVYIGGVWVSLPTPYEIPFETTALFCPSGSTTRQKTTTTDSDVIILGDAGYQLYAYEVAREIAFGKGGSIASGLISGIDLVLEGNASKIGLYTKFRQDNPAQTLRNVGSWA